MKRIAENKAPFDADARKSVKPVICYPIETLPLPHMSRYSAARATMKLTDEMIVPPRDAGAFRVTAGSFFRIVSVDGPQVGDLNRCAGRPDRTILQRQNLRAAWHPPEHR
jgi:uncharacterized protein